MKRRSKSSQNILLGAHFSIAGGLHKAIFTASEYGCTALQIFTKNSNQWRERILTDDEIERFNQAREQTGIKSISSHTSYLINLGSPDKSKFNRSIKALKYELVRSSQLGISRVIMHPGSHMGKGEEKGLRRVALGINKTFDAAPKITCRLLLETTAGQGSNLGYTFEHLARISELVEAEEQIGFCFDTCHTFAAGYDLRTRSAYQKTMRAFDHILGLDRLCAIHLNDAKKGLGSKRDRHEHIGKGAIGIDAFRCIMNDPRLRSVPKILETPKGKGPDDFDRMNLKLLRSLVRQ
jgi:deoxyribonuclease-4